MMDAIGAAPTLSRHAGDGMAEGRGPVATIEPHGALLVLDPDRLVVWQAAGDTAGLLGMAPDVLTGLSLGRVLGSALADGVREHIPGPGSKAVAVLEAALPQGGEGHLALHRTEGGLLLEIERSAADGSWHPSPTAVLQAMVSGLREAATPAQLCAMAVSALRKATGFDRVAVHRILPDGSTMPVSVEGAAASELPLPPEILDLSAGITLIADAGRAPSAVPPALNPPAGAPPDLDARLLLAAHPALREALLAHGTRACLAFPIGNGIRPWGLVVAQHRSPRVLGARLRMAAALAAEAITLRLEALEHEAATERMLQARTALLGALRDDPDLAEGLIARRAALQDLLPGEGVALLLRGRYAAAGRTPPEAAVRRLAAWIALRPGDGLFATARLDADYPGAAELLPAAGAALAILPEAEDVILWFRAPSAEGHGGAEPWRPEACTAAHGLRLGILELMLRQRERAARERQDFLMAELDHRVKNTLANIQSLLRQSGASATEIGPFVRDFGRRLQAMASAHGLIARSRWEGAPLRRLIEVALAAQLGTQADDPARAVIEGPDIQLRPGAALALGLALHELATNAMKYGALSVPAGRVTVCWHLAGNQVELEWTEGGGPPAAPPMRRGFGMTVIERSLAYDIGGGVSLAFMADGLRCTIRMPVRHLVDGGASGSVNADPLWGARVLLVESRSPTAPDQGADLIAGGVALMSPCTTVEAHALLHEGAPDAAILDAELEDGATFALADSLAARGIPFAFTTARDRAEALPPRFHDRPVLPKPRQGGATTALLRALLASGGGRG
ncbi:MAG TPA: HWE histidine kinase domain-containing protein [Acetobacteraceae bacterium]|nr:HWE histidine kinase domain-containing protein [Acetobacteraceae bacterium]